MWTFAGQQDPDPLLWRRAPESGVIDLPGCYYLASDIEASRDIGISINADNVVLDLQGRQLRYAGPVHEGTFGIHISGKENVSIRNGSIEGFWVGIQANEASRLVVEGMLLSNIPYIGVNVAHSANVDIANNQFNDFRDDIERSADKYIIGVNAGAVDLTIRGNRFEHSRVDPDIRPYAEILFVLLVADQARNAVIVHNQMQMDRLIANSYGIWSAAGTQMTVAHNRIINLHHSVILEAGEALIAHNHMEATSVTDSVRMETVGVCASNNACVTAIRNDIRNLQYAFTFQRAGGTVAQNRIFCEPNQNGSAAGAYGIFRNDETDLTLQENMMDGICVPVYDVIS